MTAVNVLRTPTAVHVFTDGMAATEPEDGADPVGAVTKTLVLPHLNAVVAVNGWAFMLQAIQGTFNLGATSFDDLRDKCSSLIMESLDNHRVLYSRAPSQRFRIFVAGWSETAGPSGYVVGNEAEEEIPAWTPTDLGDFNMTPGTPELEAKIRAAMPNVSSIEAFDPERDGLTVLKMQRRAYPKDVGAFAQITTVRAGEITTKILHRWPLKLAPEAERQANISRLKAKYGV